jgi:hypothetical protein
MTTAVMKEKATASTGAIDALVYCPICTHSVPAKVTIVRNAAGRKVPRVVAGQRCTRCSSPLDAAYVLKVSEAA